MISFRKKYFIQKCLTGIALIMLGCADRIFPAPWEWLFYVFLAVYVIGMIWSAVRKSEPEDERAIENIRKARSHLYDLVLILMFVNVLFSHWNGSQLELTGEMVLILFGLMQFGEYFHFLRFEKSLSDE